MSAIPPADKRVMVRGEHRTGLCVAVADQLVLVWKYDGVTARIVLCQGAPSASCLAMTGRELIRGDEECGGSCSREALTTSATAPDRALLREWLPAFYAEPLSSGQRAILRAMWRWLPVIDKAAASCGHPRTITRPGPPALITCISCSEAWFVQDAPGCRDLGATA